MINSLHIKPNKTAFLGIGFLRIFMVITVSIIIILGLIFLSIISNGQPCEGLECLDPTLSMFCPSLIGIFTIVYALLATLNLYISYNKEVYTIEEQRIIIKKGGLFYDTSSELSIKNITFLDLELPFIENTLFKTGKIAITSAGTGLLSSLQMVSLSKPEIVFQSIEEKMQNNGFKLERKQLLMEAKPDTIGIILNILRKTGGFGSFLFFAYFFINIFLITLTSNLVWPMLTFVLFTILYLSAVIIRFLDLKQRRYQVFEDCVHYKKGFLTKHSSFIPVENLSDSHTTQTFMQKIFGVYDIEISSKGIASEIKFKNLTQGEEIEKAIDKIAIDYQKDIHTKPQQNQESTRQSINTDEKHWQTTDFTSQIKMNPIVAFIQYLISLIASSFFLILILLSSSGSSQEMLANLVFYGIFVAIGLIFSTLSKIFQIFYTKYEVSQNSIKEQYKFLSTKNKEFNIQKITAIIMIRTLIDRLFNTCSIKFISIGSSSDITFEHINRDEQFLKQLALKFGFDATEQPKQEIKAHFTITRMLLKEMVAYLVLAFIVLISFIGLILFSNIEFQTLLPYLVLMVIVFLVIFMLRAIYDSYYHKKTLLKLYDDKMILEQGLINLSQTLARYDNIKDMKATKWPFTKVGSMQINIAGDQIVQNGKNRNQNNNTNNTAVQPFSNKLHIDYLDKVHLLLDTLEEYFQSQPQTPVDMAVAKPALANTLFPLIIISIFAWPLIPFIPLFIIELRKREYIIQENRVMERKGILNISLTSILYGKIDNINKSERAFNKMFGNGSITLETAGSLTPELVISNIKEHNKIYELIRENYSQKHKSSN